MNTNQIKNTIWTETSIWILSSIITAVVLLSAVYFTKVLLVICLVSLVAIFLGILVAAIRVLIKDIIDWNE